MFEKLSRLPFALLASWQFERALGAASREDYRSAIEGVRKAQKMWGKPGIEFALLEAHCLFQLKDLEQSKRCFDDALKLIGASKRLTEDDRSYLLNYMDGHFQIDPAQINYKASSAIDLRKVRRRFVRQFPL